MSGKFYLRIFVFPALLLLFLVSIHAAYSGMCIYDNTTDDFEERVCRDEEEKDDCGGDFQKDYSCDGPPYDGLCIRTKNKGEYCDDSATPSECLFPFPSSDWQEDFIIGGSKSDVPKCRKGCCRNSTFVFDQNVYEVRCMEDHPSANFYPGSCEENIRTNGTVHIDVKNDSDEKITTPITIDSSFGITVNDNGPSDDNGDQGTIVFDHPISTYDFTFYAEGYKSKTRTFEVVEVGNQFTVNLTRAVQLNGTIEFTVYDNSTSETLEGASVDCHTGNCTLDPMSSAITNSQGEATIYPHNGTSDFEIDHSDCRMEIKTVHVDSGQKRNVDVNLTNCGGCQNDDDCEEDEVCRNEECYDTCFSFYGEGHCFDTVSLCDAANNGDGEVDSALTCPEGEVCCTVEEQEELACDDSDGGINIYEKGEIKGYDSYGGNINKINNYTDKCDGNRVMEFYCEYINDPHDGLGYISMANKPCDNGCEDGACIREEQQEFTCTDTDGGNKKYKYGVVKTSDGTFKDNCVGDSVNESYCGGSEVISVTRTCEYGCKEGACLKKPTEVSYLDEEGWISGVGDINDDDLSQGGYESLHVRGDYAYTLAPGEDTLSIIDVSDPSSPKSKGSITDDESTSFNIPSSLYVSGDHAYISSTSNDVLSIIDISDPQNPEEVGSLKESDMSVDRGEPKYGGFYERFVQVSGDYAYLTNEYNALFVIDISDPSNPKEVGVITKEEANLNHPTHLTVSGNYAIVISYQDDGISIIDISEPTEPEQVGFIQDEVSGGSATMLEHPTDVESFGNHVYVTSHSGYGDSPKDGLSIIDISNLEEPAEVGTIYKSIMYDPVSIEVTGDYVHVAGIDNDSLSLIDVSDPSDPKLIDTIDAPKARIDPREVDVSGKYAYVTSNSGVLDDLNPYYGMSIIEISKKLEKESSVLKASWKRNIALEGQGVPIEVKLTEGQEEMIFKIFYEEGGIEQIGRISSTGKTTSDWQTELVDDNTTRLYFKILKDGKEIFNSKTKVENNEMSKYNGVLKVYSPDFELNNTNPGDPRAKMEELKPGNRVYKDVQNNNIVAWNSDDATNKSILSTIWNGKNVSEIFYRGRTIGYDEDGNRIDHLDYCINSTHVSEGYMDEDSCEVKVEPRKCPHKCFFERGACDSFDYVPFAINGYLYTYVDINPYMNKNDCGGDTNPLTGNFIKNIWSGSLGSITGHTTRNQDIDWESGWNLVGVPMPMKPRDLKTECSSVSTVYGWNESRGTYIRKPNLKPGKAYWVYARDNCDFDIQTEAESSYEIRLDENNWNLISPIKNISTEKIKKECGVYPMYYYWEDSKYKLETEVLEGGRGYWALPNGTCVLNLGSSFSIEREIISTGSSSYEVTLDINVPEDLDDKMIIAEQVTNATVKSENADLAGGDVVAWFDVKAEDKELTYQVMPQKPNVHFKGKMGLVDKGKDFNIMGDDEVNK